MKQFRNKRQMVGIYFPTKFDNLNDGFIFESKTAILNNIIHETKSIKRPKKRLAQVQSKIQNAVQKNHSDMVSAERHKDTKLWEAYNETAKNPIDFTDWKNKQTARQNKYNKRRK